MRISKRKSVRIVFVMTILAFFGMQAVLLIKGINEKIFPQVEQMAKAEASNAATQIILRAVNTIEVNPSECFRLTRDEQGEITDVSYDTFQLNQILSDCLSAAQSSLNAASLGEIDPNTRMIYYDRGVIYSVHLGYFTGIALFSQMGPQIDVHMQVLGFCNGKIEVKSTPYGINSTLVEIDLLMNTELLVITPFLLSQAPVEVRIPLVIQIVHGKLPEYLLD